MSECMWREPVVTEENWGPRNFVVWGHLSLDRGGALYKIGISQLNYNIPRMQNKER